MMERSQVKRHVVVDIEPTCRQDFQTAVSINGLYQVAGGIIIPDEIFPWLLVEPGVIEAYTAQKFTCLVTWPGFQSGVWVLTKYLRIWSAANTDMRPRDAAPYDPTTHQMDWDPYPYN